MSWNVNAIGMPEKVAAAVESAIAGHSGQSRDELAAAAPHLIALVGRVFETRTPAANGYPQRPGVRLSASGSGTVEAGKEVSSSISVTIETVWNFVG